MAYVKVDVVFNEFNQVLRRTAVYEQDFDKIGFLVSPKENFYLLNGEDKTLATIEKIDDSYKFIKFVEAIYIDNLEVFNHTDYFYNCYMDNGELVCELEPKITIDVPELYVLDLK